MNPVRLIQMQKRMVQIEKELDDLREKIEDKDIHLADRNILVGLIRNLIGQKSRLSVAMSGKTYEQYNKDWFEKLKQDELRRQKEKPPSKGLEEMMKYEMSPERVAARTKEFEDHRKEQYIDGVLVVPGETKVLVKDARVIPDGVYVMGEKTGHDLAYQRPNRKVKWSHGVAVGGKTVMMERETRPGCVGWLRKPKP